MILVDTSLWIDHINTPVAELQDLLNADEVLIHPMVIGEIACGTIRNRAEVVHYLRSLPMIVEVSHERVFQEIEAGGFMGLPKGAGNRVHRRSPVKLGNRRRQRVPLDQRPPAGPVSRQRITKLPVNWESRSLNALGSPTSAFPVIAMRNGRMIISSQVC